VEELRMSLYRALFAHYWPKLPSRRRMDRNRREAWDATCAMLPEDMPTQQAHEVVESVWARMTKKEVVQARIYMQVGFLKAPPPPPPPPKSLRPPKAPPVQVAPPVPVPKAPDPIKEFLDTHCEKSEGNSINLGSFWRRYNVGRNERVSLHAAPDLLASALGQEVLDGWRLSGYRWK